MRKDEEGVAQVIEFTASITILVLVFTAFFTALGFQAALFSGSSDRVTGKTVAVSTYIMSDTGYYELLDRNGTDWESMTDDEIVNMTTIAELPRFGLSNGEYGVLSYEKVVRLGSINATTNSFFDAAVRSSLGLSFLHEDSGFRQLIYDVNITVKLLDGTKLAAWGAPLDDEHFIEKSHNVITRVVVIEYPDDTRVAGRLTIDLMPLT